MNTINLSQIISSQRQTISRWQQNSNRDALDLASEIARRFRLSTRVEFEGFIWDYADMYAKQAAYLLSEMFSEEIERHFGSGIQSLKDKLIPLVGEQAPNINETETNVSQRALSLAVDDSPFRAALAKAKPGVFAHILAPSMMDDNWDEWAQQQTNRACDALSVVVENRLPELSNSVAKFLDAALDEYLQGLTLINYSEPVVEL